MLKWQDECFTWMRYPDIVSVMPRKRDIGNRLVKLPIALPEQLYEWLRGSAFERRVPMAGIMEALFAYSSQPAQTTPRVLRQPTRREGRGSSRFYTRDGTKSKL
jgi:hypothetical protein